MLSFFLSFTCCLLAFLIFRRLLRSRLPARLSCWLWTPFLLRLLFPVGFSQQIDSFQQTAPIIMFLRPMTNHFFFPWPLLLLAGILLLLLYRLGAALYLRRRIRRCQIPVPPDLRQTHLRLQQQLGMRSEIPIQYLEHSGASCLRGLLYPKILLSADTRSMKPEQVHYILLHELIHAKRRDQWLYALINLLCAVYWFFPPVWLMAAVLKIDIERACDEDLLQVVGQHHYKDYGLALIEYAALPGTRRFSSPGFLRGRELSLRIQHIKKSRHISTFLTVVSCCLTILLAIPAFCFGSVFVWRLPADQPYPSSTNSWVGSRVINEDSMYSQPPPSQPPI